MNDNNKPKMNDAALTNIVLPLVISMIAIGSLIEWLLEEEGEIPLLLFLAAFAPLIWVWMHREAWRNRHK